MQPKISLFASSIRPHLWDAMFKSLEGTSVEIEVVFAGNSLDGDDLKLGHIEVARNIAKYDMLKYIPTGDIKPAQCYEVARRACTGELIMWIADDCEFPNDVLGKAYRFYRDNCGYKDVLCMRTREHYHGWIECDNTQHHFFSATPEAPKMAPIGMMTREYFQELGGIDRRYIAGQWDNDLMMRIYNDGGKLHYFDDGVIELDHKNKHDPEFGISDKRPFGQGYVFDRAILEKSWGRKGIMKYTLPYERFDEFEPYEDKDITTKSQSQNMERLWPE